MILLLFTNVYYVMANNKVAFLSNHFSGYNVLKLIESNIDLLLIQPTSKQTKNTSGFVDFDTNEFQNKEKYFIRSYNLSDDINEFEQLKVDVLLVAGYQRLVPKEILENCRLGAFGFHGSSNKLPKGRGRSPINWEIINGKKNFIIHMFELTENADEGGILDHREFKIEPSDNVKTVYHKVAFFIAEMILDQLPKILENKHSSSLQKGNATYFKKRTKEDSLIDFNKTTYEIYNFVRALADPYPNAFFYFNENKIIVKRAYPFLDQSVFFKNSKKAGDLIQILSNNEYLFKTNDGSIILEA